MFISQYFLGNIKKQKEVKFNNMYWGQGQYGSYGQGGYPPQQTPVIYLILQFNNFFRLGLQDFVCTPTGLGQQCDPEVERPKFGLEKTKQTKYISNQV